MSTEETIANAGESSADQPLIEDNSSNLSEPAGSSDAPTRKDDEENRSSAEDFGSLLDQFEQEQSSLQEGEVVRGTVVGLTERGVVIDFGYKSEGIVNPAEFTEHGEITVKPGDEVEVLVKS